jgi:hypothetical protein
MPVEFTLTISLGILVSLLILIFKHRKSIARIVKSIKKNIESREANILRNSLKVIGAEMKLVIHDVMANLGNKEVFDFMDQIRLIIKSFRAKFES